MTEREQRRQQRMERGKTRAQGPRRQQRAEPTPQPPSEATTCPTPETT